MVAVVAVGCFVGYSQLRGLGSAAVDKLLPALQRGEELPSALGKAETLLSSGLEKVKELLPGAEGDGNGAQSGSGSEGLESQGGLGSSDGAGAGAWPLPSLSGASLGGGRLFSVDDVALVPTDDYGQGYVFSYGGEEFSAYFGPYSWKVYDSYRIANHNDIVIICQALLDEHPVLGSDWESQRTAEDMAYEWEQHNLAYNVLPADSPWRDDAKDVDLDPDDQGKSVDELYESRTGQKLDLSNYLSM